MIVIYEINFCLANKNLELAWALCTNTFCRWKNVHDQIWSGVTRPDENGSLSQVIVKLVNA